MPESACTLNKYAYTSFAESVLFEYIHFLKSIRKTEENEKKMWQFDHAFRLSHPMDDAKCKMQNAKMHRTPTMYASNRNVIPGMKSNHEIIL